MAKSTFLIVALLNFALVCYARPQDSNSDRPKCDDFPGYRYFAINCYANLNLKIDHNLFFCEKMRVSNKMFARRRFCQQAPR